MFTPLVALFLGAIVAWPVAVMAWSLPDRWFDPLSLHRAPRKAVGLSVAASVLASVWAAVTVPDFALPGVMGLGWALIILAVVDARALTLPDRITLPLIAVGIGHSAWINAMPAMDPFDHVWAAAHAITAAAIGYLFLTIVALVFRSVRGIEGLGMGDAKLLAAGGAWLGLAALPTIVLLAAVTGLVVAVVAHRRTKSEAPLGKTVIPFGPYLAGSIWIVALYGPLSFT